MKKRAKFDWSEKNLATMKSMWAQGFSSGEISKKLGATRSSVMAKITRMGFQKNASVHGTRNVVIEKQKNPRLGAAYKKNKDASKAFGEPKKLIDLQAGECLWPLGDPKKHDFHYCSAKTETAKARYCDRHRAAAYRKH